MTNQFSCVADKNKVDQHFGKKGKFHSFHFGFYLVDVIYTVLLFCTKSHLLSFMKQTVIWISFLIVLLAKSCFCSFYQVVHFDHLEHQSK